MDQHNNHMVGEHMKRFTSGPFGESIIDKVTGKHYSLYYDDSGDAIVELLNELSDRADKVIESYTTKELLHLKWQRDIYKRFSEMTMRILERHNINSLEELDSKLFWRRL